MIGSDDADAQFDETTEEALRACVQDLLEKEVELLQEMESLSEMDEQ